MVATVEWFQFKSLFDIQGIRFSCIFNWISYNLLMCIFCQIVSDLSIYTFVTKAIVMLFAYPFLSEFVGPLHIMNGLLVKMNCERDK
jgi:hypothetical protein